MLEVLVAIVVLSFGVLGVVGLQAAALQANKEARYQSTAAALARELGDLMRGNTGIAITTGAGNPYLGDFTTIPTANPTCAPCASTTEVAQFHMRDWMTRVSQALPNYRVVVCFDATPYSTTDNMPQWACTDSGGVAVVKVGWTRAGLSAAASSPERATRPTIVLPLIAG